MSDPEDSSTVAGAVIRHMPNAFPDAPYRMYGGGVLVATGADRSEVEAYARGDPDAVAAREESP